METATRDPQALPGAANAPLFGEESPAIAGAAALILVLAISVIDKLTGYGLQLGVLHLVPIALATWALGRLGGLAFALLAIAIWMAMFRGAIETRANLYFYWDAAVLFGTFLAFVLVIGRLRDALRRQGFGSLDRLPAPAYVIDAAGRIVYRNEAFRDALAGRTPEELERYPALEAEVRWPGARRARLRILTV